MNALADKVHNKECHACKYTNKKCHTRIQPTEAVYLPSNFKLPTRLCDGSKTTNELTVLLFVTFILTKA